MHVDAPLGGGKVKSVPSGQNLTFISGEANTILGQVLSHILLAMELGGLWVEVHAKLSFEMGSLPLLFRHDLAFACVTDNTRLASLRRLWRRFCGEDWEKRSGRRRRQEIEDAKMRG